MRRLWRLIKFIGSRLLIVLVSFLIILLILELFVRIFIPQQLVNVRPDVWRPDEKGRGHVFQPNLDTEMNTGERIVRLLTDDKGYRIGFDGVVDNPEIRILAVGDSFLEALQVDYEYTMTALLENALTEDLNTSVRIVNTGVGGYDPRHYYIVTKQELQETKYDLVIVFVYVGNDLIDYELTEQMSPRQSKSHSLRIPRNLSRGELVDSILYPINDFLEANSHLYIFFRTRSLTLLARIGLSPYYISDSIMTKNENSPAWDITTEALVATANEAKQQGVPIMFGLLPTDSQVIPGALNWRLEAFGISESEINLDQPSEIWGRKLTEQDVTYYDMLSVLRDAFEDGVADLYGRIDAHFGMGGHSTVANFLHPILLEQLCKTSRDKLDANVCP